MKSTKATRSLSVQEQFTGNRNFAFSGTFLNFGNLGTTSAPRYGDPRRDAFLSSWWKDEPILSGALNTVIKRMKSTGYNIEGGRNNAMRWARKFQHANDGRGWQDFIERWVLDYETTDLGAFAELGLDADGRPSEIYNIDSLKCSPWHEKDYPFVYMQPSGKAVKLSANQVIHHSDMTSPREEHRGRGYCAVSRLMRAGEAITAIYDYEMQKLGKLPPQAVVTIRGLTKQQFADAWEEYKANRKKEGLDIYTGIFWVGGDDPNLPVEIEITDIARVPDGFDRNAALESWVKTVALNLGVDVGELWLIQHVGATKASQSVQHQKALGKGTGEIHAMLEMAFNVRVLPADVMFAFDFQDDEQDRQRAEILQIKINNLIALYTQSSRGPSQLGGIAAPFSRSGAANITSEPQPQTVGQLDLTPPLITRDQVIDLGTRWGVFPAGFFGQEVTTVAGMILKEAGLYAEDDLIRVTHDMKVYKLDKYAKQKHFREAAKLLVARLKEEGAVELLNKLPIAELESLYA